MDENTEKRGFDLGYARNLVLSVVIGGLAGAAAMLLFAPQSGKQTRAQIQKQGIRLFVRSTDAGKNAFAQVRSDTQEMATGVREKAGQLKQLGKDTLVKQLDRASEAVKAA